MPHEKPASVEFFWASTSLPEEFFPSGFQSPLTTLPSGGGGRHLLYHRLVILQVRPLGQWHQHHLGTCGKCTFLTSYPRPAESGTLEMGSSNLGFHWPFRRFWCTLRLESLYKEEKNGSNSCFAAVHVHSPVLNTWCSAKL